MLMEPSPVQAVGIGHAGGHEVGTGKHGGLGGVAGEPPPA